VSARGPQQAVHKDADDVTVDDAGTLIVTAREGRGERTVAVYAAGMWVSAEVL